MKQARTRKRHSLATRLWHWLNVICVPVLFMSGLNIFNAHPRLYWGHWGFAKADAWLALPRFPGWMTIPDYYSLAAGRLWHLLFAWPFAFGLLAFMLISLANRHFSRDIVTRRKDWQWASIKTDIARHLKLDFAESGTKYNFLQKLSYGIVLFILLPGMILTGLAMSPAMDANWPLIVDLFGGRQSARSIHFIFAWTLVAFFAVHIILVILSGPFRQIRDMITGGRSTETMTEAEQQP